MSSSAAVAQILRLHEVERWRAGTIARHLHVHRPRRLPIRDSAWSLSGILCAGHSMTNRSMYAKSLRPADEVSAGKFRHQQRPRPEQVLVDDEGPSGWRRHLARTAAVARRLGFWIGVRVPGIFG